MIDRLLLYITYAIGAGFSIILLRYAWLWWTRVRPRVPELHREWWSDCAELGHAEINGDAIEITNVRDFTWRSSKDHDVKWVTKNVDATKIKDVWFIIDHFHRLRALAHTMISFEFEGGSCRVPWKKRSPCERNTTGSHLIDLRNDCRGA